MRDTIDLTYQDMTEMLGTPVDPALPLRGHTVALPGQLDYRVSYGALTIPAEPARRLWKAAGLTSSAAQAFTAVLLPAGWRVEPGDPPPWWPRDPATLQDLRARPLAPNGWLAMGYAHGTAYLLATRAGTAEV